MTLRFGVIGTAYWAREIHVPGFWRLEPMSLGFGGEQLRPQSAIAQERGLQAFQTLDDLLDACDAVTIAVPAGCPGECCPASGTGWKAFAARKASHSRREECTTYRCRRIGAGSRNEGLFLRRFIPEIAAAIAFGEGQRLDAGRHSCACIRDATKSPYFRLDMAPSARCQPCGILAQHVLSVLIPHDGSSHRCRGPAGT